MEAVAAARTERWELYRLLADPVRLKLLALTAHDELAVSELSQLLGESQPNVSRHAAPLRQAGLLLDRRQGTWTLLRLAADATDDAVVADALNAGQALCARDGSLSRVAEIVRSRDAGTREFFDRRKTEAPLGPSTEQGAYLAALSVLLPQRRLAIDAGAGEGPSLEVLAPLFDRVIALDRSKAQLALAQERVKARGFDNVKLVLGELGGPEVRKALEGSPGADVVLAARMLHHAPKPAAAVRELAQLLAPGGTLVVIDYGRHQDESLRERQADLWLGFETRDLLDYARAAGLESARVQPLPRFLVGDGPDRHVPWLALVAQRSIASAAPSVTSRRRTK